MGIKCFNKSCSCHEEEQERGYRRAHSTFISELIAAQSEIHCLRNQLDLANEEIRKLEHLVYRNSHLF